MKIGQNISMNFFIDTINKDHRYSATTKQKNNYKQKTVTITYSSIKLMNNQQIPYIPTKLSKTKTSNKLSDTYVCFLKPTCTLVIGHPKDSIDINTVYNSLNCSKE